MDEKPNPGEFSHNLFIEVWQLKKRGGELNWMVALRGKYGKMKVFFYRGKVWVC